MAPTRFRPLLAVLAAFALLLLQSPVQAKPPVKPVTPPGPLPACVLTLEVSQLHWTLDPVEHLKDHINALQFDIPADPGFCKDVKLGTVLDDKFRWGSWLFRQNYGQWSVRVVGKRLRGESDSAQTVPQASSLTPPPSPASRASALPAPVPNPPATPVRTSAEPFDPGPAPVLEPVMKPAIEAKQP